MRPWGDKQKSLDFHARLCYNIATGATSVLHRAYRYNLSRLRRLTAGNCPVTVFLLFLRDYTPSHRFMRCDGHLRLLTVRCGLRPPSHSTVRNLLIFQVAVYPTVYAVACNPVILWVLTVALLLPYRIVTP